MAKNITQYRIIEGTVPVTREGEVAEGLARIVEQYLGNGWKLEGGAFLVDDHNAADVHLVGQAMTRKVKA